MTAKAIPTEDQEQIAIINWTSYMANRDPRYGMIFHIANGGSRGKAEAGRFRAEGVKSGVPDLMLPVPSGIYAGLFIELKRVKGGKVSEAQKKWIADLNDNGYYACVCYGAEEAIDTIKRYLSNEL